MDDSDNEDGNKMNGSGADKAKSGSIKDSSKSKKRRVIYSSDEDEPKPLKETNSTVSSKVAKLKAVNVSNAFGSAPIKRIEKEKKPNKSKEQDVFDADTDDMELMNVDDELLSPKSKKHNSLKKDNKVKEEKQIKKESKVDLKKDYKSPEKLKVDKIKAEKKTPEKKTPVKVKIEKKTPIKSEKMSPNDSTKNEKSSKKNGENSSKKRSAGDTPTSNKKPKKSPDDSELDRSVYDPDEEKHEKRRAAAVLYKQFQKRAGPSNPGSKEIPKGKPNCLAGLAFVLTGVYESMERDEAAAVIKDLGGRVTSALSGKTNYVVAGEESGPAKLAKADDLNIPILSEDDLLDLIREKSGLPTLKKNSKVKEEKHTKSPSKPEKKSPKDIKTEKRSPTKHDPPKKIKVQEKNNKVEGNFHFLMFYLNIQN